MNRAPQKKKKNKGNKTGGDNEIKDSKSYNRVAFMYDMDASTPTKSFDDVGKWKLSEPRESSLNQKEQWAYLGLMDRFAGYTSGQPFKNSQGRSLLSDVVRFRFTLETFNFTI